MFSIGLTSTTRGPGELRAILHNFVADASFICSRSIGLVFALNKWADTSRPVRRNSASEYNLSMSANVRIDRVLDQLRLYEHPILNFSARAKGEGVEVIIQFKDSSVPVHTYYFDLHPRDLDHPQFEWSFQRQLYDALHDYFVEMFIRTPQDREDRRQKAL
jgi:hypothetical protein